MTEDELLAADLASVWHPFTQMQGYRPLLATGGSGPWLHTPRGRLLDGISSWWVSVHGHAHPQLVQAIAAQAARLDQVIFADYTHAPAVALASRLLALAGPSWSRVFYSDNGSTAVEVALKMTLHWHHRMGQPQRRTFIALEGAYHGDTVGAMSVSGRGLFTEPFSRVMFPAEYLPLPQDEASMAAALDKLHSLLQRDDIAGFIAEPMLQGAGGMRLYPAAHLDQLLAAVHAADLPTILDEVFTGFGRTGTMLAQHQLSEQATFICLSKGLTGGMLPLGATLVQPKVFDAFLGSGMEQAFLHGHSFTANPMACAVACASLDIFEQPEYQAGMRTLTELQTQGAARLGSIPSLRRPRCTGPLLAADLPADDAGYASKAARALYGQLLERGVYMRPMGNTVYFLPPYITPAEEVERVHTLLEELFIIHL